jgi:hypothetical protein
VTLVRSQPPCHSHSHLDISDKPISHTCSTESYTKHATGKGVHCYYCKNCTTHVYHAQEALGPDNIVLRTGLLDEGIKNFKPAAQIYTKARLPWEKEVATSFETMPPS